MQQRAEETLHNLYCHNKLYRQWCSAHRSVCCVLLCCVMLCVVLCYMLCFMTADQFVEVFVLLCYVAMLCFIMSCYVMFCVMCCYVLCYILWQLIALFVEVFFFLCCYVIYYVICCVMCYDGWSVCLLKYLCYFMVWYNITT